MTSKSLAHCLPEVREFLDSSPLKGVLGGRDVESSNGETLTTLDPGSKEPLATVYAMQPDDVDRAVRAAATAFSDSGWASMAANERGVLLHRLADAVEKRKPILAQIEALDAGKVLSQAEGDVQNFIDTLRYYTDLALHVQRRSPLAVARHEAWITRQPWGPCGFIFPWNFPILLIGWNISPALAAGNTVVIKPAEDTPLSAIYLARLAREVGIPDGVINVVPGYGPVTGAALAGHPGLKRMSFTGSPEVGRSIAEACGRNLVPVKLELGGKGAAVVFDDADLERTVEKLILAITFHTGQVCCDATRWIVHRPIYDQFVSACAERLRQVKIGHQMDASTEMGPVVNEKQRQRVLGYLKRGRDEGADVVLEGGEAEVPGRDGFYVKPALLAGSLDNVAAREEIFGPVAYLAAFTDEEDAVRMANRTDYGLANSVWTSDLTRAGRVAEAMLAGNSWINAHNLFPHGVPYAGVNKSGLGGGVLSVETLFDYWRNLSVVRPL
ncbi:MAG: aldehyde dehydrogenase family protein [Thermoguttaceae bacterium]|jgi:aldehyde dehydrogenase (NAD+)